MSGSLDVRKSSKDCDDDDHAHEDTPIFLEVLHVGAEAVKCLRKVDTRVHGVKLGTLALAMPTMHLYVM